jgi:hypothetical protein
MAVAFMTEGTGGAAGGRGGRRQVGPACQPHKRGRRGGGRPAGLGRGPEKERGGKEWWAGRESASRPKWREVKAGKRICFPFSNLIFKSHFQMIFKSFQKFIKTTHHKNTCATACTHEHFLTL